MAEAQTYRLTVLLHPQSSAAERRSVEEFVTSWVRERHGDIRALTVDEKAKLAYAINHQPGVTRLHAVFTAPPTDTRELLERLNLEHHVLRTRVFRGEMPTGKRLKDVPIPRPGAGGQKLDLKTVPVKEKAPLEKLEEKIEKILEEEVL